VFFHYTGFNWFADLLRRSVKASPLCKYNAMEIKLAIGWWGLKEIVFGHFRRW